MLSIFIESVYLQPVHAVYYSSNPQRGFLQLLRPQINNQLTGTGSLWHNKKMEMKMREWMKENFFKRLDVDESVWENLAESVEFKP